MWQKVAKFKGAEYFRKALYILYSIPLLHLAYAVLYHYTFIYFYVHILHSFTLVCIR